MPANIYIVDDDESVCRALKVLLSTYDFEVKHLILRKVFLMPCLLMSLVVYF